MSDALPVLIDLFCGAGGISTGILEAAGELGMECELIAINHWQTAIDTHQSNHPHVRHLCKSIDNVNPRMVVPGGKVRLLAASPECTHHSNARGGKPMNEQSRATAWHVLRWAEALHIEEIVVENVKEFVNWGPLGADGRPIHRMKGRTYRDFLQTLRGLGYAVETRVLCAADFGDATSRERLFIRARKGSKRPSWPEPTHIRIDALGMFPKALPWRPAREIIDWSLKGKSIYGRKKALVPKTLARIDAGLRKFSGLPFIVPQFGERAAQSPRTHAIHDPLPAVLAMAQAH